MLTTKAGIYFLHDISQLETTVRERNISLVVVELSRYWKKDLSAVHSLKTSFPQVLVVIVNGEESEEAVIQSFRIGAKDFFKKPYKKKLLAERVEALLKKRNASR